MFVTPLNENCIFIIVGHVAILQRMFERNDVYAHTHIGCIVIIEIKLSVSNGLLSQSCKIRSKKFLLVISKKKNRKPTGSSIVLRT